MRCGGSFSGRIALSVAVCVAIGSLRVFTQSFLLNGNLQQQFKSSSSYDLTEYLFAESSAPRPEPPPSLYWNLSCPFEQSMWSVPHFYDSDGNLSKEDDIYDDVARAREAWMISKNANTTQIVAQVIQSGWFRGRNIFFDGDSTTKQLFVSLGCLAWSTSLIDSYDITYVPTVNPITGKRLPIRKLPNLVIEGEGSYFKAAEFSFKGGGFVRYHQTAYGHMRDRWTPACRRSSNLADTFPWHEHKYSSYNNAKTSRALSTVSNADVLVLGGVLSPKARNGTVDAYTDFLDCVKYKRAAGLLSNTTSRWPGLFVYMKTNMQHFLSSSTGEYPILPGASTVCSTAQSSYSPFQQEDDRTFNNKSDYFLGEHFDQRNLGRLHVSHGDCTHWIQPGVPDILASELVTFLRQS
jgi:hypothetical protein